jgi:TRAP transporter 4TM/12TM fusion protein
MAEFLQVPYSEVALAATIPAILYYLALFIQVDLDAARTNIRPMAPDQIPRLSTVLKKGWHFPIPFAVLIYAMFWLNYEPEQAGLLAIATALVFAFIFPFQERRLNLRDIYEMLRDTGQSVLDLFMLGAAAGIMIGALGYSGAGFTLTVVLIHLAGGSLIGLLVLSGIANIILGTGLPTVACYIVLATLVAPSLIQMGIDPMAAHMFILYYGCLSAISPPVAIAAFIAANLAEADHNKTGWTAMAFGWTIFVIPFLFVFSPTLLLKGPWPLIAINFITAVAGIWFIAAAVMGYSFRQLRLADRLVYGIAGLLLLLPVELFELAKWLNALGALLGIALTAWERVVWLRHGGHEKRKTAPALPSIDADSAPMPPRATAVQPGSFTSLD